MQVEGIYTAEPRFEAQAKALKLKQEMAAAAAEEQKRLRGMPGLDLVETPKPLERQIRAEVEAKVKERAPEAVRQTQTSKVFAKPEVYDRAVTPGSIAGLGEAASVARLRGAMANLAYNQNKLRQLADEPLTTTGGEALSPTLGNLDRWLDQPRQRKRYETQRLVQRLVQKLPTLDYLSWADRGMPRPETYTKENLTDYVPRIEQLANYPWEMTKEMRSEAKEVINTAHTVGTIGNGGSLVNFDPYRQALAAKDDEAAAKWADLFYKLDGNVHTKQYAVGKGFMDGTGYTSAMDVITQLSPLEQPKQEFKAFQNGADLAAKKEPALNSAAYLAGRYAQLRTLGELTGMGLNARGASGPYVPYIRAGLTFGASQAIQESGDLATGRISLPEYLNHLSKVEKQGMFAQALGELFAAGYYGAHYGGHGMGNGVPQLPGGTGASTGTSLMPQTGAPSNSLINIRNRDIVAIAGALQERGVGARDAILTAIDLAEIKRKAGENALTMTEKAFDEAFEKGFNYDIMQEIRETYSDKLKEELKSGRAREESKEEFIRRATAEGYTTYDRQDTCYGFRRVEYPSGRKAGKEVEASFRAQEELKMLGIQADVIDTEVLYNRNGITRRKRILQAATLSHGHVVINYMLDMPFKETAGHEAFHLWESGFGREEYVEILRDNLVFSSEDFIHFQNEIAQHYMNGQIDVTNDEEFDALAEEIFAYLSGMIHAGDRDAFLRPMFRDYDAVKAAWYELIRKNR